MAERAGSCVRGGGSCPRVLPVDSCCRPVPALPQAPAAAAALALFSLSAAARVPCQAGGTAAAAGGEAILPRSASHRPPLRGCVIAMARRLFPGAWLRKPHYAQVGRQRAVPRGGRARQAGASTLPSPLSPSAKLPQERAPPAGLAASPGRARAPFPPAGAWRRTGLGCAAARRLGGSRHRGWGTCRGRRAPWQRVLGHGSRCRAAPGTRCLLLPTPPVGSGLSCRPWGAASSAERPAGPVTRSPPAASARAGSQDSVEQLHPGAAGPQEPSCFSPHVPPYSHRQCCGHPSSQRVDQSWQEQTRLFT